MIPASRKPLPRGKMLTPTNAWFMATKDENIGNTDIIGLSIYGYGYIDVVIGIREN